MAQTLYDVLVIGGGHAGAEAAHAAARMGARTALITLDRGKIGMMSCNPAIGGLAKGQLVKEIDALGGLMGRITDRAGIQFRQLNASKGPAVRSSRAQCDKLLYARTMQDVLSAVSGLDLLEGEVSELLFDEKTNKIQGVMLSGEPLHASSVVITSGTFLRAIMHTGDEKSTGGRVGERASTGLSPSIERLGFRLRRLKTGTPPRLHRRSIPWDQLPIQAGDPQPTPFSFFTETLNFPVLPQVPCHVTYTNEQTHQIIEANFGRSPMYRGDITGAGPRYCPSIEDKVKRFRDKERHQVFLEPEGLDVDEVYVNGISTSLPRDVQEAFVRSIVGLEKAEFIRYGYAVEYDAVDARQLKRTYESKDWGGLFFAGQVNGTSGYEEAAAQGLIAGINAAAKALDRDPFILQRDQAYMGVLADDLTLKGSDEPYRMFTSRAEFRLLLREDNADMRLSELGHQVGVLGDEDFRRFSDKKAKMERFSSHLKGYYFTPKAETLRRFEELGYNVQLKDRISAWELLKRPKVVLDEILSDLNFDETLEPAWRGAVETEARYEGYIKRDLELLERVRKSDAMKIPPTIDYAGIGGLSNEVKNRLLEARPETIGQASRLQGITPASIANLVIHLRMRERA